MSDPLHDLSFGDVLREHRRSRPLRTAVVCGAARLTYAELDERANRLAQVLRGSGLRRGDRVLWLGQNCHRVIELLYAAAKIGAVLCPANWRLSAGEMATLVAHSAPSVVVYQDGEIGSTVTAARAMCEDRTSALWIRHDADDTDAGGYEALVAASAAVDPGDEGITVDPRAALLQLATAAFDGVARGAQLSHEAILSQDLVTALVQRIDEETVYLSSGPMFHMATLMTTFATLRMGGVNVITRRVEAEELCRLIAAEHVTNGLVMGPTAAKIIEINADGRYDLSSLRTFPGSPSWNAMVSADDSPWGRRPAGYGQTEVCGLVTFNALGATGTGTSGRVSPLAQVRIVDPDGAEVPAGETGEIVCRGPIVMNGYFADESGNAARRRGGWHHTGDLGRREPDGSLTFVGPATRLIKSAAENIYPVEVEACLTAHPAVREAAVIGVPDRVWTQRVVAIVAFHEGSSATAEELIAHCRERIASYKKPTAVEVVDTLPRDGFAVDYGALDARFGGGGYPGEG